MNVVLVSSAGRCGINEYSAILRAGFEAAGHRARHIGVEREVKADLYTRMREVAPDDNIVIFEYIPGVFKLQHLVPLMADLRFRQHKQVYLSIHEMPLHGFDEYRYIQSRLMEPSWQRSWKEPIHLTIGAYKVAKAYATLRIYLSLVGILSHRIVVHSPLGQQMAVLVTANESKLHYVPHVVKPLEGDRNDIRRELGLSADAFAFIVAGFLFRRKRIPEIINQLPPGAELWVVGTTSPFDPGCLEEIQSHLAYSGKQNQVRIIQDYENMERYLVAADAAVLYYSELYQSGVISQAIGARKPSIFSDLPGFIDVREAGIPVSNNAQLRQALIDIQEPARYAQLAAAAGRLRDSLSPAHIGQAYLS